MLFKIVAAGITRILSEHTNMTNIAESPGGWEGWMQVELYCQLAGTQRLIFTREQPYPGTNEKCDLVLNSERQELWVELKCQSHWREDKEFGKAVQKDIEKINALSTYNRFGVLFVISRIPEYENEKFFGADKLFEVHDQWYYLALFKSY